MTEPDTATTERAAESGHHHRPVIWHFIRIFAIPDHLGLESS